MIEEVSAKGLNTKRFIKEGLKNPVIPMVESLGESDL